jgi:serine/threonine protein kinase
MSKSVIAADSKRLSSNSLESSILSCCGSISSIGSGSNGVVLSSTFTRQPTSRRIPLHRKLALKVMSHFWDASARLLLDCERKTLAYLPPHPSIIRVFEEFEESLPQVIVPFLTPAMQQAARSTVSGVSADLQTNKNQTQFFVMEFHPSTLDNWRNIWPAPMPWHILYRISHDLLSVAVHMQRHSVGHLDLKLDNILVGYDGRSILTDFGISRVFDNGSNMTLQYKEPFGLLMNRLVLAPEVLAYYDRAMKAWKRLVDTSQSRNGSSTSGSGLSSNAISSSSGGASALPCENVSPQDMRDLTIGFSTQCVWSIGVVLYELACGFNHEPTYPEDGGGMRGSSYAMNTLVPLPAFGSQAGVFRTASDGSLRRFDPSGYPSAFCGLVFSMLNADPLQRVTAEEAFLLIQALQPSYSFDSIDTLQTQSAVTLPDGTPLKLTHEISCVEKDHSDGQSMLVLHERISSDGLELSPSSTPLVPVLLRHWSGSCRLVRVTADLTVHQVAVCWSVGLQININSHYEASDVKEEDATEKPRLTPTSRVEPSEDSIAQCRIFLGGYEAQGHGLISDLIDLLQPLSHEQSVSASLNKDLPSTTSDVDDERWSDDEGDSVTTKSKVTKSAAPPNPPPRILTKHVVQNSLESNGGILILDLVPSEADTTIVSAKHVLDEMEEICGGLKLSNWNAPAPLLLQGDASSSIPRSIMSDSKEIRSHSLKSFDNFVYDFGRLGPLTVSSFAAASKHHTQSIPNNDATCALVDMREAFLYRSLLTLTGLSNAALRHPNAPFPYQECSRFSVLATLWFPTNHETVAAAVGVLRNVSCTESLSTATAMVNFGAVRACASAYFQPWKTTTDIDNVRRCGNYDDSSLSNSSTFLTLKNLPSSNSKFHGRDVRCAEDCILGASNFLRFDEIQVHSINVPTLTLALMCADAMDSFPKDQSMQNSASTLMRYMLSMDEPDNGPRSAGLAELTDRKEPTVVEALVRAGCIRGLSLAMKQFPSDRSIIENALHIICTLLVFDDYRTTSLCPYKLCAEAVIAVMNHPGMADNTYVLNLGASALRNLACVTDDNINFTESPAIMVTQAGAATVLEDVMSKHPNLASLQENGRCALYNLLLLGAKDAITLSKRTALAELSKAELQSRLAAAESQLRSQNEVEVGHININGLSPPHRKNKSALPSTHLSDSSQPSIDVSSTTTSNAPNDPPVIVNVNEWATKPSRSKDNSDVQPRNKNIRNASNAVSREVNVQWEAEKVRLIRLLILASIFIVSSLAAMIALAVTWKK